MRIPDAGWQTTNNNEVYNYDSLLRISVVLIRTHKDSTLVQIINYQHYDVSGKKIRNSEK